MEQASCSLLCCTADEPPSLEDDVNQKKAVLAASRPKKSTEASVISQAVFTPASRESSAGRSPGLCRGFLCVEEKKCIPQVNCAF
jgi:hypothetical protein